MTGNKKIYVIGCGNELAGDDGVGIAVVRKLTTEHNLPDNVKLIEAGVPGLSLVELMLGVGKVILVDAFLGKATPGKIKSFTENELPKASFYSGQTHGIGLREALSFMRGVLPEESPPEIVIIGIEIGEPRRWVEGLSSPVRASLDEAAERVKAEVLYA